MTYLARTMSGAPDAWQKFNRFRTCSQIRAMSSNRRTSMSAVYSLVSGAAAAPR
jgi:hypothetical protein